MKLFDPQKPFYKGNLHTHTTNSDGRMSPEEVIERYQAAGYDFLALTDHWKISIESPRFYKNMLLLQGIELDYNLVNEVIHVVGINVSPDLLTRVDRRQTARRGIREIVCAGGRAILAHPAWSLNTLETMQELTDLTAVEIYNSVSALPWNGDRADSMLLLDIAGAHGLLLNTVASDDSHFYTGEDRTSFTMLQTDELSAEGIGKALDAGTFYASRGPRFRQIEIENGVIHVECDPVQKIVFHSDLPYVRNRCVQGENLTEATYEINFDRLERFVRVILIDKQGRRAWANPIDVARLQQANP